MGDAAGIGAEIVLKALNDQSLRRICHPIIIGDLPFLRGETARLAIDLELVDFIDLVESAPRQIGVFNLANLPSTIEVGKDSAVTGRAAAECVFSAVELWREGKIDAIATAPISKAAIHMGGFDFPGHTEFLAEMTGTKSFAMSFFAEKLRVILLSTHVSLEDAIGLVKKDAIVELIQFADAELFALLKRKPKIAVAGLNPHASEGGKFGRQEIEEIEPAIDRCKSEFGIDVSGPFSPDTIFLRANKGEFDAVIALYHDQATIAVKCLSFGSAVNVTLGLPLIRTSVDHGTGYDIAGKDLADASSMKAAIVLAAELVVQKEI